MMFSKKIKAVQIDTLIGSTSKVVGDLHYGGGLQIEGTVEGNLMARCEDGCVLVISESGTVEGEIRGPYVVINGTVHGDVHVSSSIELKKGAKVTGDIYYHSLEMEAGAEINGKLVHRQSPGIEDAHNRDID